MRHIKVSLTGLAGEPVEADVREAGGQGGVNGGGGGGGGARPIVFLHGLVGLNEHWEDVVGRMRKDAPEKVRSVLLEMHLLGLRGDDCSIDGATHLTIKFLQQYFPSGPVGVAPPAGYVPLPGAGSGTGLGASGGASVAVGGPSQVRPSWSGPVGAVQGSTETAKPILVGNSFGGHVALKIALERPDLIGGLVLAGASGLIEKSMVSDIQIKPSREWLERKIGELFFDPAKNMNQADVDRAHGVLTDRHSARAMIKLSRSARRNHLGDEIHKITVPTLVLWGRQDVVTPPEAAHDFYAKISNSQIRWFENCGHAPMIEASGPFAESLLAFAERVGRGGSILENDPNGSATSIAAKAGN